MLSASSLLLFVMVVVAAYAERAYFNGVASVEAPMLTDEEIGTEIRSTPKALVPIVVSQTRARLVALATPQERSALEAKRRIALACIVALLATLVWIAWFQ